ncbi:MAG TPA: hypothetical protein VNT79_03845 [Phycisphaerae bacterium]|nr:hypothetical protein [Phycisphaerae bacterium]
MRTNLPSPPVSALADRVDCPSCEMTMALVLIEPHKRRHELRTYRCPACNATKGFILKSEED